MRKFLDTDFVMVTLVRSKAQDDRKSLFFWEEKSPFGENDAGVGAKKSKELSIWMWGVFPVVLLGPFVNNNNETVTDSMFILYYDNDLIKRLDSLLFLNY